MLTARRTKNHRDTVRRITSNFFTLLKEHLAKGYEVEIGGFGVFHTAEFIFTAANGDKKPARRVQFKKSLVFKRKYLDQPRETVMEEKYGVDESGAEQEKAAAEGCPVCGKKAEVHGNLLMCPTHGSEPWEKKEK